MNKCHARSCDSQGCTGIIVLILVIGWMISSAVDDLSEKIAEPCTAVEEAAP